MGDRLGVLIGSGSAAGLALGARTVLTGRAYVYGLPLRTRPRAALHRHPEGLGNTIRVSDLRLL
jgi:isopentenyl diphosphate isomerase/L-lactate dehydrogenase-like FMN-dependent dehydrogenase